MCPVALEGSLGRSVCLAEVASGERGGEAVGVSPAVVGGGLPMGGVVDGGAVC